MKRLACILSIILVVLPVALVYSCRSNPATTTTTEEDTTTEAITTLASTHWKLQSINGVNLLPNSYISLYFRDQQVFGLSGANRYDGKYTEEPDGKLKISDTMVTLLLGPSQQINDQEKSYIQAFEKTANYIFKDHKLTINDASGQALLVFIKLPEYPADPAQLINTKWRVLSIGNEAVKKGTTGTIAFDDKGNMSGSDGSFTYNFQYRAQGDELTWGLQTWNVVNGSNVSPDEERNNIIGALPWVANYRLVNGQLQLFSMIGDKGTIVLVPVK
jgi:heat shock protein HslJ